MIKITHGLWMIALFTLTACGSSHRVTYSGREESTQGVPGFVNGKKVSPHVKLGQSYTVDGEEYTPRHQPDYVEEGMASWYGPGFHGGKTANGEEFDKYEMTAAHRTLPLPSIVKVTMLSTGKSVYVRVNDRGPFAKGRIIDLSKAAAQEIGLIGKGVAKVRVEYRAKESQRFADLLAEGRDPKSIDLSGDVLSKTNDYAEGGTKNRGNINWWNALNPISSAQASETSHAAVSTRTEASAPVTNVASHDVAPATSSPFEVMGDAGADAVAELPPASNSARETVIENDEISEKDASKISATQPDEAARPAPSATENSSYLQLGAFRDMGNATRLSTRAGSVGPARVLDKQAGDGSVLHHVVMSGFLNVEQMQETLARLQALGIDARVVQN